MDEAGAEDAPSPIDPANSTTSTVKTRLEMNETVPHLSTEQPKPKEIDMMFETTIGVLAAS